MSDEQTPSTASVEAERARRLASLHRYARWLDASLTVPGLGWRVGVDSLVGLIPGVGDGVGAALAVPILYQAWRLGARRGTLLQMVGRIVLESLVGTVPVLGDLFDVWFKANQRNVAQLEREFGSD